MKFEYIDLDSFYKMDIELYNKLKKNEWSMVKMCKELHVITDTMKVIRISRTGKMLDSFNYKYFNEDDVDILYTFNKDDILL